MDAENRVVNNACQGHVFEEVVHAVENRVRHIGILSQPLLALFIKPEALVDPPVLVVAPQKINFVGELNLQGQQQTHGFQRVVPPIHIVSQENVGVIVFFAEASEFIGFRVAGPSPEVEEAHKVRILPVDVSENFDGRFGFDQNRLMLDDLLRLGDQLQDVLNAENKLRVWSQVRVRFRLKKVGDEVLGN